MSKSKDQKFIKTKPYIPMLPKNNSVLKTNDLTNPKESF